MDDFERELTRMMRDGRRHAPFEPGQRARLYEGIRVRRRSRVLWRAGGSALAVAGLSIGLSLLPGAGSRSLPADRPPLPATSPTSPPPSPLPTATAPSTSLPPTGVPGTTAPGSGGTPTFPPSGTPDATPSATATPSSPPLPTRAPSTPPSTEEAESPSTTAGGG
ncbi:cellulase [Streptomyces griseoflavus]|uniref:cellulase n=1 Tax=Streptomyces griseoflavus TaxID=35619 RepID=UPI0033B9C81B